MNYQSIGKEKAIALAKTQWWEGRTAKQIAMFQHFTNELCMDFRDFHKALESALGRPVWTHEIALDRDAIGLELVGEKDPPTMEEILNLIPEEKRIIVFAPDQEAA